jgi:hypothetical protein
MGNALGANIPLAWDPNPAPEGVSGYKIHYGLSSRHYDHVEDAGNVTQYLLRILPPGRYYIVATAYDRYKNTSDYSEELVVDVTETSYTAVSTPEISDLMITTPEDIPVDGQCKNALPSGTSCSFAVDTSPTKGTVVFTDPAAGKFRYDPAPDVNGDDVFIYKATCSGQDTIKGRVKVSITPVNDIPFGKDGVCLTTEDCSVQGRLEATDADGDSLVFVLDALPKRGTVTLTDPRAGTFIYTPNRDVSGQDSFTFEVSDSHGGSYPSTLSVQITPRNDRPWVRDVVLSTLEKTPLSGTLSAGDVEGSPLTFTLTSQPSGGTVTLTDAHKGEFTYAPSTGTIGPDSFTFQVSDGELLSESATVTVDVLPHVKLYLEAEDGTIRPPMIVSLSDSASAGACLSVPAGIPEQSVPNEENEGKAEYVFDVPTSGQYYLWFRVMTPSPEANVLFVAVDEGAPLQWEAAIGGSGNWVWDSLSDHTGGPSRLTHLEAGTHRLGLYAGKAGMSVDQILITTNPEPFDGWVYEDAESGTSEKWQPVSENSPPGEIVNLPDPGRMSRVIELTVGATRTQTFYRHGGDSKYGWGDSVRNVAQWSMKASPGFLAGFDLETSTGSCYLLYMPASEGLLMGGDRVIIVGLGESAGDGKWHSFVRDIRQDVAAANPRIHILSINGFLVSGNGRLDDIKLR